MVDLLESLMCEPLFNELRTKQQLGYTVDCSARNTHGLLGFMIRSCSKVASLITLTFLISMPRLTFLYLSWRAGYKALQKIRNILLVR